MLFYSSFSVLLYSILFHVCCIYIPLRCILVHDLTIVLCHGTFYYVYHTILYYMMLCDNLFCSVLCCYYILFTLHQILSYCKGKGS